MVSGYPDVQKAMTAILLQADEVLVKPFDVEKLAELIGKRLLKGKSFPTPTRENVASILNCDATITMQRWLSRVDSVKELTTLPLTAEERTAHLPEMIRDITARLRALRVLEAIATPRLQRWRTDDSATTKATLHPCSCRSHVSCKCAASRPSNVTWPS